MSIQPDLSPSDDSDLMDQQASHGLATITPDLEPLLPPNLWHRFSTAPARRGVLLNVLNRLRSVQYNLSTYLPRHLVQEKLARPVRGETRGTFLHGSVLFADVSGFTTLSERLAGQGRRGAEALTEIINDYFGQMIDILARSDGILLKFAGDALLVFFPAQPEEQQVDWALRAARRMMRAMEGFAAIPTPLGQIALRMKIGIATGRLAAFEAGSSLRMEYVVEGDVIARTMAAEGTATAGQIVIDQASAARLAPDALQVKEAFFALARPVAEPGLDDYEVRAQTGRLRRTSPWLADTQQTVGEIRHVFNQIQALSPYLAPELVAHIIDNSRQRRLTSDFRPVTVMFANLNGLDQLLQHLPIDAPPMSAATNVTDLLSAYVRNMDGIITGLGGILARVDPYSRGSKMLVLFGAPVAHEDDPGRAVRAALAMCAKLDELNARWRRKLAIGEAPLLRQRIGITQGIVFAGQAGSATRREYTVMGDDVNLAARLMAAAQPGQVLLAPSVQNAVADSIITKPLAPIRVKGKSQPVALFEAVALRPDPIAQRPAKRMPLYGRQAELAACQQAILQARQGEGSLLALVGPAGSGKSSLAQAVTTLAGQYELETHSAKSHAFRANTPYAPWSDLLRSLAAVRADDDERRTRARLDQLARQAGLNASPQRQALSLLLNLPPKQNVRLASRTKPKAAGQPANPTAQPTALFAVLGERAGQNRSGGKNLWQLAGERQRDRTGPDWQQLQRHVESSTRDRSLQAMRAILLARAGRRPLFILFEDAQWMDPASLQLLAALGQDIRQWPICILLAVRDQLPPPLRPTHQLVLGPLERESVLKWTADMLPATIDPAEHDAWAGEILQQSAGNPLLIEELLLWCRRTAPDSPRELGRALGSSDVLQQLVTSHIDSLTAIERRTIQAASIVELRFSGRDIGPLIEPECTAGEIGTTLARLEREKLIARDDGEGQDSFRFRSNLVRALVYQGMAFSQRRALHRQRADHLAACNAGQLATIADDLAFHYRHAEAWSEAGRWYILGGQQALHRSDTGRAGELFQSALDCLASVEDRSPAGIDTARAQEGLGDAALLASALADAASAYEQALTCAPEQLGAGQAFRLNLKWVLALAGSDQLQRALANVQDLRAASETEAALAAAARVWLYWRAGRQEAAAQVPDALLAPADRPARHALSIEALLHHLAGRWERAAGSFLACDHPACAALALCQHGRALLEQDEVGRAIAHFQRAADLWEAIDDPFGLAVAHALLAMADLRGARLQDARHHLGQSQALFAACGATAGRQLEAIDSIVASLARGETIDPSVLNWQTYIDVCHIAILLDPIATDQGETSR